MSKGMQIAIGAAAIAALLVWYGAGQLGSGVGFQYFQDLDEFHASESQMLGRAARVHGYVANGSIERDLEGKRVRFSVQNAPPHKGGPIGQTLEVEFGSLETPDLFKDGAEVVVEGQLAVAGGRPVFQADNVMAKCPSKFQAQSPLAGEPSIEL
ncbi:MAG: cytochrome c maturation protein CcmE [Spirochaetaceae bacterium]|nr:cytochrome c maturation protein CcmE [Myxococcales bacterium]MCB9724517.1 cytochrome c maturation protein CcmE [Spirochaetaceae bacterium]